MQTCHAPAVGQAGQLMGEAKKWGGAHGGPRGFRVELGDVTQEGHREA